MWPQVTNQWRHYGNALASCRKCGWNPAAREKARWSKLKNCLFQMHCSNPCSRSLCTHTWSWTSLVQHWPNSQCYVKITHQTTLKGRLASAACFTQSGLDPHAGPTASPSCTQDKQDSPTAGNSEKRGRNSRGGRSFTAPPNPVTTQGGTCPKDSKTNQHFTAQLLPTAIAPFSQKMNHCQTEVGYC